MNTDTIRDLKQGVEPFGDDSPDKLPPLAPSVLAAGIARMSRFAALFPDLVRGVARANFHKDYVELVWSKYDHAIPELQTVARQFKHLDWSITRSDSGSTNLDWLCDFGDVMVRLQGADVLKLDRLPSTVDFSKLPELRRNEPELQTQEEA